MMDHMLGQEPRWLSDDEQRVWREFIAATAMLNAHLDQRLQAEAAIPHTYYGVLVALSEAPGRSLRMSELAAAVEFSRSRLSHAIARMESAGWVTRCSRDDDRRSSVASLTPEGMKVLRAAAPGHVEAVRQALFDVLSPQQVEQLGEISAAIAGKLRPECEAAKAAELADGAC